MTMRETISKRIDLAERRSKGEDGTFKVLLARVGEDDPERFENEARERYGRGGFAVVWLTEADRGLL